MNSKNRLFIVFFLFFCFNLGSCEPNRLQMADIVIERSEAGQVIVRAELARTQEEQSQGLMYRRRLDDGYGMLFIFSRDDMYSFWMKNTYIPLSIAFISSDGQITEIRDMRPHDESHTRSSRSVRYALEVPQGWFDRVHIQVGDRLLLDSIR